MENVKLKNMPLSSLASNFVIFITIIIPLNILAQNSPIDSHSPHFYELEDSLVNIYNIDPQNEQNLMSYEVIFQGCAEKRFCYTPIKVKLSSLQVL